MRPALATAALTSFCLLAAVPAKASPTPGGSPNRLYFAEGTTRAGFQEYLALENLGPEAAVTVTYQFPDGSTRDHSLNLAAVSRTTIDVNQEVGPGRDVATIVDAGSATGVVAERPLYFHACLPICVEGEHTAVGSRPGTQWYFAEGFTGQGFQEYLTLQNPGASPAAVNIVYAFPDGSTTQRALTLGPASRATVDVNSQLGPELQVSALITSDQPIVAERALYFDTCVGAQPVCARGGHDATGVSAATSWDFAEGNTGPGYQEYLLLLNPGSSPTSAAIDYLTPGGGGVSQAVDLPPHSRRTVDANAAAGSTTPAAHITSGTPIVAERALYQHACSPICTAGGSAAHGLSPSTSWDFAEGYTGAGSQEFITLSNPSSQPATVTAHYLTGLPSDPQTVQVPARSRRTINVNLSSGVNGDVSVHLDGDQPIVAERPMYFSGCLGVIPVCVNLPPRPVRPSHRDLNVPFIRQTRALTCESAALQMALASEGVHTDQETIMATMGIDRRPALFDPSGRLQTWGNPNLAFVGNPDGSESNYTGYGVYSGPIAAAATKLGGRVLRTGPSVPPGDLYDAILDGHPVVAWIAYDYRRHPLQTYQTYDGQTVGLAIWEHAVTVVGVNRDSVLIHDPLSQPSWHSKAEFEATYATFNQMAVVLE